MLRKLPLALTGAAQVAGHEIAHALAALVRQMMPHYQAPGVRPTFPVRVGAAAV